MKLKARWGVGYEKNLHLISKEDYLHTGTREKDIQTITHNLREL